MNKYGGNKFSYKGFLKCKWKDLGLKYELKGKRNMWLPKFLYQSKPHLIVGAGVLCVFAFDNTLGDVAGWVLVAAGGLIYWARSR